MRNKICHGTDGINGADGPYNIGRCPFYLFRVFPSSAKKIALHFTIFKK